METVRSYRCPKKGGGCGRDSEWIVAIVEEAVPVLVCECNACGHRMSFSLSEDKIGPWIGPIDMTGKAIRT